MDLTSSTPSLWLRIALHVTTFAPGSAARGVTIPVSWSLRFASPKWACVWHNHLDELSRLRAIVMPEPWVGRDWRYWNALLMHQMHRLGLTSRDAEVAELITADSILSGQISSFRKNLHLGTES